MQFKRVTLEQKDLINHYLSGRKHNLMTYNFTNIFLWRDWDPYGWEIVADAMCIKSDFYGWDAVLVPFSPDDQAILSATEQLIAWYEERQVPFLMTEVSEEMWAFFQKHWPGRFTASEYRDGFNYTYLRDDLANLPGHKYSAKRNHVRRFERENPGFQFLPLTEEWLESCRERQLEWIKVHDQESDEIRQEHVGVLSALENWRALDCTGAVIVINDVVEAFTIGEPLNEDTYAIHIEKGNIEIHGTFQAINKYFAEQYCQGYRFINRAEDMGNPGQRKAKSSYQPYRLEKKFHLRLAGQK